MKTLKRIFASTLLILAICVPLYAGDVNLPAYTGPSSSPPPATCSNCDSSDESQVQTSDASSSSEITSPETSEFAVDLLLALLSLF